MGCNAGRASAGRRVGKRSHLSLQAHLSLPSYPAPSLTRPKACTMLQGLHNAGALCRPSVKTLLPELTVQQNALARCKRAASPHPHPTRRLLASCAPRAPMSYPRAGLLVRPCVNAAQSVSRRRKRRSARLCSARIRTCCVLLLGALPLRCEPSRKQRGAGSMRYCSLGRVFDFFWSAAPFT